VCISIAVMPSSAGKRQKTESASSSQSSSDVRPNWNHVYVRHPQSPQRTGVLTIDSLRFGTTMEGGLHAFPIPFNYDTVPDAALPSNFRRVGPPAALTTAVAAVNRFIDSPAFGRLLRQIASRVADAAAAEPEGDVRVADWDEVKTGGQVKQELLTLVKGMDISVVPWPSCVTVTMLSHLKARVIKTHPSVILQAHHYNCSH
jgi:hypothetical protein